MLQDELLMAKGKQWAKLVAERCDKLAEIRQDETDLMVQLLTGQIFDDAVEQIALEIRCGLYDSMLQPKENNL